VSGAILLTGGTGFLGMETLAQLIARDEDDVIVVVRAQDDADAARRLQGVLGRLYDEVPPAAARVRAVRGDLLAPSLGLTPADRRALIGEVDRIVHCAASITFDLPLAQARGINVGGVERVLELAREIDADGELRRLAHVSTAYVSGRHEGRFGEGDLDLEQGFRNTYEQSKHEAERLLARVEDLPLLIARPSIVVGHRRSGWTPVFNVLYWPIRAFERGLFEEVPARADSIVDFVPVDYVIEGLLALLDDPDATGTYNLVAGDGALSAGELAALHASLSGREPVRFVAQTGALPDSAETFVPYFDVRCNFDDTRARALLGRAGVSKPEATGYLHRLIDYAHATHWGKRPLSRQAAELACEQAARR
jgi:nucleoside-diphosphate-sugar epimerase